jgi:hypothetical protein
MRWRTFAAGMSTPCSPRQTASLTKIEEALDLLVDAADCLDLTVLIDRTGHRKGLVDQDLGERGEERIGSAEEALSPSTPP